MATIYIGKLHVVKVPSKHIDFFPYSHHLDKINGSPLVEALLQESGELVLRISCMAKMKPNIQKKRRDRIDIYAPLETISSLSQSIYKNMGGGEPVKNSEVDPDNYRVGPQTLPIIAERFSIESVLIQGKCSGYQFEGSSHLYIDFESPNVGHREMQGKEVHFGIKIDKLEGQRNTYLETKNYVPDQEIRVRGEENPVTFSPLVIRLHLSNRSARNFAHTMSILLPTI